jgi:ABC-type multidrug transport system fused ATPase/permease subunit
MSQLQLQSPVLAWPWLDGRGCLICAAGLLVHWSELQQPCPSPNAAHHPAGDLFTLVAEALDGLGVIQAYGKQQYFTQITEEHVDAAHRALFGAESLNLWLAFFCDFYGAVMVLAVACFGIGQWRELGSSNVGLAFSQSIQMLVFYTWSIRLLAETIGLFGSVEKLTWLANHAHTPGGRQAGTPCSAWQRWQEPSKEQRRQEPAR